MSTPPERQSVGTFSQYLSPAVIEELKKNPELLSLGGRQHPAEQCHRQSRRRMALPGRPPGPFVGPGSPRTATGSSHDFYIVE